MATIGRDISSVQLAESELWENGRRTRCGR
jgi:hypothetical protein